MKTKTLSSLLVIAVRQEFARSQLTGRRPGLVKSWLYG